MSVRSSVKATDVTALSCLETSSVFCWLSLNGTSFCPGHIRFFVDLNLTILGRISNIKQIKIYQSNWKLTKLKTLCSIYFCNIIVETKSISPGLRGMVVEI